MVNKYTGHLPNMALNDIVRLTGSTEDKRHGKKSFEQYVKKVRGGYHVALQNDDGDWVVGDVTDQYNPNSKFYDEWEQVDEWPPTSH